MSSPRPPRPTEDGLIARYFAPIAGEGALGLRDDAALLRPAPGHDLVLTVDGLVAGVHFFPDDPPASIARKALGVNVSDLAAKGAEPAGFLLTLALPEDWTEGWLEAFAGGLGEAARELGCPLLGGDTTRAGGVLTLSITALGQVPQGAMVPRTAARAGDRICVTGTIGDAALGLAMRLDPDAAWAQALPAEHRSHLLDRYLHPRPRVALARAVREHARAAMDVSDGLAGDLAKMLRAAGLTGEVDTAEVPLSPAARMAVGLEPSLLERALTGGDDYELLCAVPEERVGSFLEAAARAGLSAAEIGTATSGEGPPVFLEGERVLCFERGSFSHF